MCWSATATGSGCATPTGGTAYSYDGNGNQASGGNTYSNYDQLASAATVGAQTYAGTTNVERATAGSTTFTNSILGKISTTSTPHTTQEYVRDPDGTLIAMRYTTGATTAEYYYTADRVGSTILITNNAGGTAAAYSYDPYGATTTATTGGTFATSTNPWRYGGGYTDPNGTIKLGARYNPTIGRFTQPDPSGQEANRYLDAGDDPITNSDPMGLDFGDFVGDVANFAGAGAGIGTTVGAAVGLLGGPFAEITVPVGAGTGAIIGTAFGTIGGLVYGAFTDFQVIPEIFYSDLPDRISRFASQYLVEGEMSLASCPAKYGWKRMP